MNRPDRTQRVVYVVSTDSLPVIEDLFSSCGSIRAIFTWKEKKNSTHFFIEYLDADSARRARCLQRKDGDTVTQVHLLSQSPALVPRFDVLSLATPPTTTTRSGRMPDHHIPTFHSDDRPGSSKKQKTSLYSSSDNHYLDLGESTKQAPQWWTQDPLKDSKPSYALVPALPQPSGPSSAPSSAAFTVSSSASQPPNSPASHISDAEVTRAALVKITAESSALHLPRVPPTSPSIVLTCDGSQYICDLESLTEDPRSVIIILTKTAAHPLERDKWMIVAAHYRGKGNLDAAVAVVSGMMSVLTSPAVGMSEAELKPALLMLSSCHTDLGKRARELHGSDAKVTQEHFRKSQKYLRKVYGTGNTPVQAPAALSENAPLRAFTGANVTNIQTVASEAVAAAAVANAKLQGQIVDMKREMQSLQDRNTSNIAYLSQSRIAKRKLEEEVDAERRARRKVKMELDGVKEELMSARRGERHALEQCRREVDSRRRAEEKIEAMGEMERKVREAAIKEQNARECFSRLGAAFLKAARGEGDVDGLSLEPRLVQASIKQCPDDTGSEMDISPVQESGPFKGFGIDP
ncbi:hypothetical protein BXZ70DRAFT_35680 [Cristinia sonorae]|uniref:RRM domain-containing protein n=1 Tax=Cristinia sonorae TaxID=1940300 RepID=A0A8K0V0W3_9AGAR|nr:hypothetical protein BXZ70DRAFT_35680 [Cristinia sonorae]